MSHFYGSLCTDGLFIYHVSADTAFFLVQL